MHRIVALLLLALFLVQGVLPGRAMACATDPAPVASAEDGNDRSPVHAHHHAPADAAATEASANPASERNAPPQSHDAGHCLMAVCVAPALAPPEHATRGHAAATSDLALPVVVVPHSAASVPDTPPPRG